MVRKVKVLPVSVAEMIDANLTRQEQIHYLATGTGFLGSSYEYILNVHKKFVELGIHDEDVAALLRDTESYMNRC